jgi:hypothetical protein
MADARTLAVTEADSPAGVSEDTILHVWINTCVPHNIQGTSSIVDFVCAPTIFEVSDRAQFRF